MFHQIFLGILLGWGAAIPIGPMNLEIVRRNLSQGTICGTCFGLGACSADLTYIVLLSLGALAILTHPGVLQIVGVVGSLILMWFAYKAFTTKSAADDSSKVSEQVPIWQHYLGGYCLTLLNPYTILFWASVSSQIAVLSHKGHASIVFAGLGVMIGTVSWVVGLNTVLHFTRHKISARVMRWFNYLGGLILLIFALFGLLHAL